MVSLAEFIRSAFTGAAEVAVGNAVERLEKMNKARAEHLTKPAPAPAYVQPREFSDAQIIGLIHLRRFGVTNCEVRYSEREDAKTFRIWSGRECFHPIEMVVDGHVIMCASNPKRMVMEMVDCLERQCFCVQRPGDDA